MNQLIIINYKSVTGIQAHIKICTQCNSKWSNVVNKCYAKKANLFCKECISDNKNNNKNNKDKNKKIPANQIKRFAREDEIEIDITPQLSEEQTPQVLELIQQCYKIDKGEHAYFKTFEIAREYFITKLSYAKHVENIFEYHRPEAIKTNHITSYPDMFFFLNFKDIMSLCNNDKPTEGVVDFVLDCFNFYLQNTEPLDSPASITFGKSMDVHKVVPSMSNHITLNSYYTTSTKSKTVKEKEEMTEHLKHWYNNHDKDILNDCLDFYQRKNMMITTYASIFKLNNEDYALSLVKFHQRLNSPNKSHAQTLCFCKGHDTELETIQVWMAKYFGLYFKEQRLLDFTEEDFDGKDIKIALDHPNDLDNENELSSIISRKSMKYKIAIDDTNNSALYCLGYCLARMKKVSTTSVMGKSEKEMNQFAKRFRLCTLSLICDMYELFNNKIYEKYECHLRMMNGDYNNDRDLRKWKLVHYLFDNGAYEFNMKKKMNANTVMTYKNKQLNLKLNELTKASNKKRPPSLSQTEKDNKRQKLDKLNVEKIVAMELYELRSMYHTRHELVFDLSNMEVVLISDPESIIDDVVHPTHCYAPHQFATSIEDFLNRRYSKDLETEQEVNKRKDMIFDIMKKFDTYFMLEPGDKGKYIICAAMVIETSLKFQNDTSSTIIHMTVPDFGYEDKRHMKVLLYHVFKQKKFFQQTSCVVVYQFGNHEFTLIPPKSIRTDNESNTSNNIDDENESISNTDSDNNEQNTDNESEKQNETHVESETSAKETNLENEVNKDDEVIDRNEDNKENAVEEKEDTKSIVSSTNVTETNIVPNEVIDDNVKVTNKEVELNKDEEKIQDQSQQEDKSNKYNDQNKGIEGVELDKEEEEMEDISQKGDKSNKNDNELINDANDDIESVVSDPNKQNNEKKIDISKIYSVLDLFQDMGFVKQDCPEIENDIPVKSKTLIGENEMIRKWCESKAEIIAGRTTQNKYKICQLHGNKRLKYRFVDNSYEVYTHAFGWNKASDHDFKNLSYQRKEYAKSNSGAEFVYRGFGARNTIANKDLATFDYDMPIPKCFKQQSYSTENNCVWLSTALVVNAIDINDGKYMIDLFVKNKQKFEWMSIKRNKQNLHQQKISLMYATETLSEKLQRDIGYNLKSVSKPENRCYKDYLINNKNGGKFIVMLKLTDGQYSHVVGVDCDMGKIYDCMEDYALDLNASNFDFCGGTEGVKIDTIPVCFQLMDNMKKRPWNT